MANETAEWLRQMSEEKRLFILRQLISQLVDDRYFDDIGDLLTDFTFISEKLRACSHRDLLEDYSRGVRACSSPEHRQIGASLELIQKALQQSAHILENDPTELPGQLLTRMASLNNPIIQPLLEGAHACEEYAWLRPLDLPASSTSDPYIHTIKTGHEIKIGSLAISGDGQRILTADGDRGFYEIWDTTARKLLKTLEICSSTSTLREFLQFTLSQHEYSLDPQVISDLGAGYSPNCVRGTPEWAAALSEEDLKDQITIDALAISSEGEWLFSALRIPIICNASSPERSQFRYILEMWNIPKERCIFAVPMVLRGGLITSMALSANGLYALIGTGGGKFLICNCRKNVPGSAWILALVHSRDRQKRWVNG